MGRFNISRYVSEKILKYVPEALEGFGANLYDKGIARTLLPDFYRNVAEDITFEIRSGQILDVGMGPGYLPIEIAKRAPDIKVKGLDMSKRMVEIARRNVREAGVADQLSFVRGYGDNLPFKHDSCDMVISTGVLFTCKDPLKVLNEFHRVLKRGKEAWTVDFRRDAPKDEIKLLMRETPKKGIRRIGWLSRALPP